jgi:hypothetical protein
MDTNGGLSSKDAFELKELRLLQREKQFKKQVKALEKAKQQQKMMTSNSTFDPSYMIHHHNPSYGLYGPPPPTSLSSSSSPVTPGTPLPPGALLYYGTQQTNGKPFDILLMELHSKMDYLIRMTSHNAQHSSNSTSTTTSTSSSSSNSNSLPPIDSTGAFAFDDPKVIIHGIERLVKENERLLTQIHTQRNQFMEENEKKQQELSKQFFFLQETNKKQQDTNQQHIFQLTQELNQLTNEKNTAIQQTKQLQIQYQQVLIALETQNKTSTCKLF